MLFFRTRYENYYDLELNKQHVKDERPGNKSVSTEHNKTKATISTEKKNKSCKYKTKKEHTLAIDIAKDGASSVKHVTKSEQRPNRFRVRRKRPLNSKLVHKNNYKKHVLRKQRKRKIPVNNYQMKKRNPKVLRSSGILGRSKLGRYLRNFRPFR